MYSPLNLSRCVVFCDFRNKRQQQRRRRWRRRWRRLRKSLYSNRLLYMSMHGYEEGKKKTNSYLKIIIEIVFITELETGKKNLKHFPRTIYINSHFLKQTWKNAFIFSFCWKLVYSSYFSNRRRYKGVDYFVSLLFIPATDVSIDVKQRGWRKKKYTRIGFVNFISMAFINFCRQFSPEQFI